MSIINSEFHLEQINITQTPFAYGKEDHFLEITFARELQEEILNIPPEAWDRYDNPFEQKYTLRDKYQFPTNLSKLFEELTSESFVSKLSKKVGYTLQLDTTRNFWGVHMYNSGDKLDIHVDAGLHPTLHLKKQITLGIYLSYEWEEDYGCHLEIWRGENSVDNGAKLLERVDHIAPIFNRLVIFECNDYSWHGNPEPANCPSNSKRIFITLSYLSETTTDQNKRTKAFFVARPEDPKDEEKDKLRLLRADPEKYKEIYRVS